MVDSRLPGSVLNFTGSIIQALAILCVPIIATPLVTIPFVVILIVYMILTVNFCLENSGLKNWRNSFCEKKCLGNLRRKSFCEDLIKSGLKM